MQVEELKKYSQTDLVQLLSDFDLKDLTRLHWGLSWRKTARRKQLPPTLFLKGTRPYWGLRMGRGFGKTLTAAQWLGMEQVDHPDEIGFVVAPTSNDTRFTCFEGPTGLISVIPPIFIDEYVRSPLPTLYLSNGSIIRGFAADTPNRLRGPQAHRVWAEEIAAWLYPKEAWSNIEFGLRLGDNPRLVWTSTPKPTPFMRDRDKDRRTVVVTGSTYENAENLTDVFYENVAKYEGTAIGKQEIHGELIDPEESGFVKRSQWRLWSAFKPLPKFKFLLLSVDTAFSEEDYDKKKQVNDPTAGSVWGCFEFEKKLHVMLLHAFEKRMGFPDLVERMKKEKEKKYGDADEPKIKPMIRSKEVAGHQGRKPDLTLIETKGSGISLRQQLASENILTESYNPGQLDKLSRLHVISPMFAHGRVWTIESEHEEAKPATWAEDLIAQVCTFVGEGSLEHDDLMDTCTQALRFFLDKFPFGPFTVKIDPEELARKAAAARRAAEKASRNVYDQ